MSLSNSLRQKPALLSPVLLALRVMIMMLQVVLKPISGKSFFVDYSGPERSWSNTQNHGPARAPGPLLEYFDPTLSTSCNHTPEIVVQGESRWIRGTRGTMELGFGPGVLSLHFYILLL